MIKRYLLLLPCLALALACSSCFTPTYLMPGLTLPPGSAVQSRTTSTTTQGGGMPGMPAGSAFPGMGTLDKNLTVVFDNPGGWGAVSSHFDSFMQSRGYSDSMQMINSMGGMPAGSQSAQVQQMMQGMRTYIKMGEKFSVSLVDNNALMGGAGGGINPMGGAYMLTIVKYK